MPIYQTQGLAVLSVERGFSSAELSAGLLWSDAALSHSSRCREEREGREVEKEVEEQTGSGPELRVEPSTGMSNLPVADQTAAVFKNAK